MYVVTVRALASRVNIARSLSIPESSPLHAGNWSAAAESFGTLTTTYENVLYVSVQNVTLEKRYMNMTTIPGEEILGACAQKVAVTDGEENVAAWECPDGAQENIQVLVPGEKVGTPEVRVGDITDDGLFLGPLEINGVYVASMTTPIYNNTTIAIKGEARTVLGFMTVVFDVDSLLEVVKDTNGLGDGQVMVVGPASRFNRWNNSTGEFAIDRNTAEFRYILPPKDRPELAFTTVKGKEWKSVLDAWDFRSGQSGVNMESSDPEGEQVAIGYGVPVMADSAGDADDGSYSPVTFFATASSFLVLAVQKRSEAFDSMDQLRRIVLGSVFGMFGVIIILTFPMAHFAVRPINRLHEATKLCGRPPEYREEPKRRRWLPWVVWKRHKSERDAMADDSESVIVSHNSSGRREAFRIPQKVMIGKHWITDELTGLGHTFNHMTDELLTQYENLEAKVLQRTEELEQQKVLAEQANEAKTMFIANVSHELRTPLNGILGMCSLVLEDRTLPLRTRENLEVVFKSGELLLHLLNDLLTFSRNQVWGASVKLEAAPFRVSDLTTQIMALFGQQAQEKKIDLSYEVVPSEALDWAFMGDINRLLQVIM